MTTELHLILGPMFAGKSTFLINKATDLLNSGINISEILLINHSSDARYDTNKICSHDGNKISALSLHNLQTLDIPIKYKNIKYIFIDEGQFFNDLYESVRRLLRTKNNLQIFICGLDGDYKQEPFTNSRILDLIPYATNITKLNAKCSYCGNTAPFTKRITNSSETILVGGADDYKPVCLLHLEN
jgi:thymidine kinase